MAAAAATVSFMLRSVAEELLVQIEIFAMLSTRALMNDDKQKANVDAHRAKTRGWVQYQRKSRCGTERKVFNEGKAECL